MQKLDFNKIQRVFFIGIGGIGMSALARYFNENNKEVFGYDKVETALTRKLVGEGISVHYDDDPIWIPGKVDLVIYTPAIPEDHHQLNWFVTNKFSVYKRSEILGLLSRELRTIAVAGTHGKTSTSALISHLLTYAGIKPKAFLGGILSNYNSNYLGSESEWLVAEADEYDRSFLQLTPEILVISSMDPDHLDIYGTKEQMIAAYKLLIGQIKNDGTLIIRHDLCKHIDDALEQELLDKSVRTILYGSAGDFISEGIHIQNHQYHFDLVKNGVRISDLVSIMPGTKNIENATAAIAVVSKFDVKEELVREALKSFKGIKRRFEMVIDEEFTLIDDYAHHPEELKHAVDTLLDLYEGRHVTIIFQPHLYSRTKDFYQGFAKELSRVDRVLLMPIYPARELPIKGVSSKMIAELIEPADKVLVNEETLIQELKKNKIDVLVTLGAADLDKHHHKIIDAVKNR